MNTPPKILIVEDQQIVAMDLAARIARLGYGSAGTASSGEEALRKAEQVQPDLVLMDVGLIRGMDGIEAARKLQISCGARIIYVTGSVDEASLNRMRQTNPAGWLLKPFDENDLRQAIERVLSHPATPSA